MNAIAIKATRRRRRGFLVECAASRTFSAEREAGRTLAERLRALEHEGIVERRSYPESPPRVEYELTEKGRSLLPIIREMRKFGRSWMIPAPAKGRRAPAAH